MVVNYNPLILGFSMPSVGDLSSYNQLQKEWEDKVKRDPDYPQWLEEVKQLKEQRQQQRENAKRELSVLTQKLKCLHDKPPKYAFTWDDITVIASSLNLARKHLIPILRKRLGASGDEVILAYLKDKPRMRRLKEGLLLEGFDEE